MRRALVLSLGILAGCELPPLSLRFALTGGDSQQCYSDTGNQTTSCSDITMLCDAVLSIRIVPPNDPAVPYISVCRPLTGGQRKLCSIAGIDLPAPTVPIPEQVLEVQMAVFPSSMVSTDPTSGELVCPRVEFAANGLPVLSPPVCEDPDPARCPQVPAVGGRAFYTPGDSETVVDLGCSDLSQLTDDLTCTGVQRISVTASVNDFDDLVSPVTRTLADRLNISIGEPELLGDIYILTPGNSSELAPSTGSVPSWAAELTDLEFESTACLQVLEDGAQTTTALTCRNVASATNRIDMSGVYLNKDTLGQILGALGKTSFPDQGLVVGIVIDEFLKPLANKTVTPSCSDCSIQYLSASRTSLVPSVTSSAGIFISQDAPFGTTFSIPSAVPVAVLGGLVDGKVTIVVIQDKVPIGN
jgi:hypothetical protein